MSFHLSIQIDPHAVLGVTPGASLLEIRDAYRRKAKQHHPDTGGEEWAFRILSQSYEVLSTARVAQATEAEFRARPSRPAAASNDQGDANPGPPPRAEPRGTSAAPGGGSRPQSETIRPGVRDAVHDPAKVVDVEKLWVRFEVDHLWLLQEGNREDRFLSCCLNISWPEPELASQAETIPDGAETLSKLKAAFDEVHIRTPASNSRCKVEDHRFQGWLSYSNTQLAWSAFNKLHEELNARGAQRQAVDSRPDHSPRLALSASDGGTSRGVSPATGSSPGVFSGTSSAPPPPPRLRWEKIRASSDQCVPSIGVSQSTDASSKRRLIDHDVIVIASASRPRGARRTGRAQDREELKDRRGQEQESRTDRGDDGEEPQDQGQAKGDLDVGDEQVAFEDAPDRRRPEERRHREVRRAGPPTLRSQVSEQPSIEQADSQPDPEQDRNQRPDPGPGLGLGLGQWMVRGLRACECKRFHRRSTTSIPRCFVPIPSASLHASWRRSARSTLEGRRV